MRIVIAIGGNMISDASNKNETFEDQLMRIKDTARIIGEIIQEGHQVVITHGNGPQVGSLLLQQNADVLGSTKLPLKVLGALTQGQIGIMLQHSLLNEFRNLQIDADVVIVPTSVLVSKNDPGFENPTKPIGPFYSEDEYNSMEIPEWMVIKKLTKGYRRVVASPNPLKILEGNTIKNMVDNNKVVIAVGGGGSPTIDDDGYQLVPAVIDKDLASSVLADEIDADMLLVLTNIEGVFRNFNTDQQEQISSLNLAEARELLERNELGAGSMKPKVLACVNFVQKGKIAAITSPDHAIETIKGNAGTIISN
ncbi:MAG: carbamate kinase [Candidatus Kariarchaeaceae archaeon]|jgi:carbamate kinase